MREKVVQRIKYLMSLWPRLLWSILLASFLTSFITLLLPLTANATGEISSRSITMSTSAASAAATYKLAFTPVSNAEELIVDFCSNDPLVGDVCDFSSATVPTIGSGIASNVGTAAQDGSGTPIHTIRVTGLTMTGGTPFTINFTAGITNPSTNVSFYARVLTYATGNSSGYTPANTSGSTPVSGTYIDSGGVALSTAANISITSKVFETLAFCVYEGSSCSGGSAPALILGNSTTDALSTTGAYVNDDANYQIATNAGSGVNITMTGTTLCLSTVLINIPADCQPGAGTYSADTIAAIGTTPATSAVGTSQFGMCADTQGSSVLTAASPYADSVNNCNSGLSTGAYSGTSKFGFNDSTSTGTNSASGSQVISSTAGVPSYTGSFAFIGNVASTTTAGIYSASLNFVATGTF
jgi:hypothetical protein